MRHGQYGAYINFEQRLTGGGSGTKRGLSVFLNATYADRRTSTLDSQVAVGMLYTGPFKWRPADELGVARCATIRALRSGCGRSFATFPHIS
jgi:porin